ncbi:hypothetical protein LSAT2_032049 [Lamellibrachia satsuma]|nr:hypothetical protein LSAT2_032049 [Lamellibrachia satsuma]
MHSVGVGEEPARLQVTMGRLLALLGRVAHVQTSFSVAEKAGISRAEGWYQSWTGLVSIMDRSFTGLKMHSSFLLLFSSLVLMVAVSYGYVLERNNDPSVVLNEANDDGRIRSQRNVRPVRSRWHWSPGSWHLGSWHQGSWHQAGTMTFCDDTAVPYARLAKVYTLVLLQMFKGSFGREAPSNHIWFSIAVQLTTQESVTMEFSTSTSTASLLLLVMMTGVTAWLVKPHECAGKPYYTDTHICCDGHLYTRPEDWNVVLCCKDKMYNQDTHTCCGLESLMLNEWLYVFASECYDQQPTPSADD